MIRRVFFSFHYEDDYWRAWVVRNSNVVRNSRVIEKTTGYVDYAEWETIKRSDEAIKRWINNQLDGTSVTVVLIGSETSARPYVRYELQQSWNRGNGILGIYIHNIKDRFEKTSRRGNTHFGPIFPPKFINDYKSTFDDRFESYDWITDFGYNQGYLNLDRWIEEAAAKAKR